MSHPIEKFLEYQYACKLSLTQFVAIIRWNKPPTLRKIFRSGDRLLLWFCAIGDFFPGKILRIFGNVGQLYCWSPLIVVLFVSSVCLSKRESPVVEKFLLFFSKRFKINQWLHSELYLMHIKRSSFESFEREKITSLGLDKFWIEQLTKGFRQGWWSCKLQQRRLSTTLT